MSLDVALQRLGFRSIHFAMELYRDRNDPITHEFQAFVDTPIPLLYQELDHQFVGSRFILTRRGLEPWLSSMEWLFKHGKAKWRWDYVTHAYHQEFFGTRKYDRPKLTDKYHSYHTEVDRYFRDRPQDLLVIDLDQGFDLARLCRFLGKPEIDLQFPRANKRDESSLARRLLYAVYEQFLTSESSERRLHTLLAKVTGGRFIPQSVRPSHSSSRTAGH